MARAITAVYARKNTRIGILTDHTCTVNTEKVMQKEHTAHSPMKMTHLAQVARNRQLLLSPVLFCQTSMTLTFIVMCVTKLCEPSLVSLAICLSLTKTILQIHASSSSSSQQQQQQGKELPPC